VLKHGRLHRPKTGPKQFLNPEPCVSQEKRAESLHRPGSGVFKFRGGYMKKKIGLTAGAIVVILLGFGGGYRLLNNFMVEPPKILARSQRRLAQSELDNRAAGLVPPRRPGHFNLRNPIRMVHRPRATCAHVYDARTPEWPRVSRPLWFHSLQQESRRTRIADRLCAWRSIPRLEGLAMEESADE
jgi:hypothetical protein